MCVREARGASFSFFVPGFSSVAFLDRRTTRHKEKKAKEKKTAPIPRVMWTRALPEDNPVLRKGEKGRKGRGWGGWGGERQEKAVGRVLPVCTHGETTKREREIRKLQKSGCLKWIAYQTKDAPHNTNRRSCSLQSIFFSFSLCLVLATRRYQRDSAVCIKGKREGSAKHKKDRL
jgi:hypothetical protein